jgi:hypothetical protein
MTPPKLAANRSPNWAFMQKFEIPDYDRPERNYLTRWRIVQTPLFGVYLHRMDGPDPRPTLHDHPWNFVSFVLRGGYIERVLVDVLPGTTQRRTVTRLNVKRATDLHYIISLLHDRKPTWTLMFVGRRKRVWGYVEDDGTWTAFNLHRYNDEFNRALATRNRGV